MWGFLLALILLPALTVARAQAEEIHGEDAIFAARGVAIAWGVLKGAIEEETQVIIRILSQGASYAYVSVHGVDPFTQKRQVVLGGRPLADGLDIRSPRASFADFPRQEIHLYQTANDWHARKPTLRVYYLGVPDTTPEFISEGALFTYIDQALAKVRGAGQGRKP